MQRADVCAADDYETQERLQAVLRELDIVADDTWHDSALGIGLQRFRRGDQEITVFKDAWIVDLAGPEELVKQVLEAMNGPS